MVTHMLLYSNKTQHTAIVTIKIESTEVPEAAALVGVEEYFEKIQAKIGYLDVKVDGGKELHLADKTVGTFVSVCSAP